MSNRDNHYEAAFEQFLRYKRIPYVAVDEAKRSLLGDGSIKSLDFIVSPGGGGCSWLIDVKGRRFPSGVKQKQYWRNWSTGDDIRSLGRWEQLLGPRFGGLLVFAYNVVGDRAPLPAKRLFEHQGALYGFVAVRLDHYTCWARPLSPKWQTIYMPTARFRELAESVEDIFQRGGPLPLTGTKRSTVN